MISKLLWYLERSRSYPALRGHARHRRRFATGDEATLAVLTTPRCLDDAVWALWSFLRALEGRITPRLFVDGTLTPEQRQVFADHFPGMAVDELKPWLAARSDLGPGIRRLITSFPLGGKAALVSCLGVDGPAIYSDSDVLAFNPPFALMDGLARGQAMYLLDGDHSNYTESVVAAVAAQGRRLLPLVNSGLVALPHGLITPALLEDFLAGFTAWDSLRESWFGEQTMVAMLLAAVGGQALPREEYVVSLQRQFFFERDVDYRRIAVRHFTGPVRHVMYLKGIPFLTTLPERP
jgi:hypothetical protein